MLSQALLLREGFSAIWVWADVFKVEGLDILFSGVCDLDCFVDTCIVFVLGTEIIIEASSREPLEMEDRRSEILLAVSSMRLASSAYSRARIRTSCGAVPTVTPESCLSKDENILHRPAMKTTGEKISPCRTPLEMSKWSDVLSPIRTHPDAKKDKLIKNE